MSYEEWANQILRPLRLLRVTPKNDPHNAGTGPCDWMVIRYRTLKAWVALGGRPRL